ncbi:MAG TPA: hypothetical protein PLO61_08560 [Fimbriimonadaceae bacterium]|nr:hypothetical protein [Fimbriimonadaceae bacterium]HRJ33545.1 hypothetical protein [Fimbriimonadaceae bacterium]
MSTKKSDEVVDYDELKQMGYDRRDVSLGSFNKMIIWFYVFTTAGVIAAYGFYVLLDRFFGADAERKPVSVKRLNPDAPILQTNVTALTDIEVMRKAEDAKLKGYQWVDVPTGTVRIPIDQAMQKLAASESFGPQAPRVTPPPATSSAGTAVTELVPVPDGGGN